MLRRTFTVLLAAAAPCLVGPPTSSAATVDKIVMRNVVDVFTEPLTCDQGSPLYTFTTTSDWRIHLLSDQGRDQFAFHRAGTFTAEPVDDTAGLPDYTGRFVRHATGQRTLDNPTVVETGAAGQTVTGTGSDGSRLRYSSMGHQTFVVTPDGKVHDLVFENCRA